jgi:hypothetical protein
MVCGEVAYRRSGALIFATGCQRSELFQPGRWRNIASPLVTGTYCGAHLVGPWSLRQPRAYRREDCDASRIVQLGAGGGAAVAAIARCAITRYGPDDARYRGSGQADHADAAIVEIADIEITDAVDRNPYRDSPTERWWRAHRRRCSLACRSPRRLR